MIPYDSGRSRLGPHRRRVAVGFAALVIVVVAAVAEIASVPMRAQAPRTAGPFTIRDVVSAPFPTQLVAAPTGHRVAWIFNVAGARNVWMADGPTLAARPVTRWTGDVGQDLTALQWTPDGRSLVLVRGGPANRQGDVPNPSSDPGGAEQAIWIVAADGGEPRMVAPGSGPALSPAGDRVAFVSRGQIWAVGLADGAKAEPLVAARGRLRTLRWSPDGRRLAFVSARDTHAFVGVYDVAARSVRYLAPSVDTDGQPAWSPDGTHVAFLRVPRSADRVPFSPEIEGEPFSLVVADAASGEGREIWRAERGSGSVFRGLASDEQLFWAAGDLLVFPWEREGWTHLHAVPVAGGAARLLTPGAFEVEDAVLSPDRRAVLYVSNQDDIDRRHLWRVQVVGGTPQALTAGRGIEWSPAPLADGRSIAFLRSDARMPARPAVRAEDGAIRDLAPGSIPSSFPATALVEPQPVNVLAADGMTIPAQLFVPPGLAAGERRPAVVFFHGGSRRQMLLGWHYGLYYHHAYAFNQYLASRGFVVLSVNYRSGIGYGLRFREALRYGAAGASEFNDVLGAALYLRSRADVDPDRIAAWGGSYGGYLTAMALARAPDLFATGVDVHGVHDWTVVIRNFADTSDPVTRADLARRAFESSPMAWLDGWRAPVLVVHGDDDRNVPFSETVDLVAALRKRGVEVEQLVFPDEVHSFLRHDRWVATFEAAASFLDRKLVR